MAIVDEVLQAEPPDVFGFAVVVSSGYQSGLGEDLLPQVLFQPSGDWFRFRPGSDEGQGGIFRQHFEDRDGVVGWF
jgi:hypothetical protein